MRWYVFLIRFYCLFGCFMDFPLYFLVHFLYRLAERLGNNLQLLGGVLFCVPGSRTAAFPSCDHIQVPLAEFSGNIRPGSHVFGLFLNPEKFLGVFVLFADLFDLINWGWIKLFHPDDRYILPILALLGFQKIIINLSAAQKDPSYVLYRNIFVVKYLPETAFGKIFHRTDAFGMPQQAFRGENHQRLPEIPFHLAP